MASHLIDTGHEVKLVSYGRGYNNLKDDFDIFETEGLQIVSRDNKISMTRTVSKNLQKIPKGYNKLRQVRRKLFKEFQPECVITDFEPMTARLARKYNLPLITIDNQHQIRYLRFDCPKHLKAERRLTRNIIRAMIPRPDVSLVSTFFSGEPRNDRTFLFPPIVRSDLLRHQPTRGEHILVYLTHGFESFLEQLGNFTREKFFVYGYDREEQSGNITFRKFSNEGFLSDLASSKAVMATAGFTLISESLHLRKPYLALPMKGQFEQELNAFQLERAGFGLALREMQPQAFGHFLYRLPEFEANLATYESDDNSAIKSKLDSLLADNCAVARLYHERRKANS